MANPSVRGETYEVTTFNATLTQLFVDNQGPKEAGYDFEILAGETTFGTNDDFKMFRETAISFNRNTGGWIVQSSSLVTPFGSAGAAGWSVTINLDGSDKVRVQVTGEAGKNITWHIRTSIQPVFS